MGSTTLTMNMPPGTAPFPGATCKMEVFGKRGSTRRTVVKEEPCYCPYCRSLLGAGRSLNISPLAAIDVYSLPDETDVPHAPDRSD
jgi:hypothetical protein